MPYRFQSGTCLVQVPDEEEVRKTYEKAILEPNPPDFPYWAKIWPSAIEMTRFLDQNPALYEDKQLVEIAAGLGLPSLFAAGKAKSVLATDYLPEAIDCLRASIDANGWQNMRAAMFNWHKGLPSFTADLVLLSDTNYSPEDLEAVEQLIVHFIESGATVLLTTPLRMVAREMLIHLQEYCRYKQVDQITNSLFTYIFSSSRVSIPMGNYPF